VAQTVGVEGIAKVTVGVPVVFAKRRRRHAKLVRGLEELEDLTPVAFVSGAATVTLIHNNEVEKVRTKLLVKTRTPLVLGDGLVDGKIHFAPFVDLAVFDLPARIAKRSEDLVFGIID